MTSINASYGGGDWGLLGNLVGNVTSQKSQLDQLTAQASSGYVASDYAGLGNAAMTSLTLTPQIAQQKIWSSNIDAASGQMGVAQNALSQIGSIASSFLSQLNNLNNVNPSETDTTAASAQSALSQVAALLDTTDGDSYVFAGQDQSNPPVPNPDQITSSGFFTQINAAVASLGTNGAAATAQTTLQIASSNTAGTTAFSTSLSAGTIAQTSVQVGDSQFVTTGILANANASVSSTGTSTTSSYTRDIMRALATIGSLTSSQAASDPGFQTLVQDTRTSLQGAVTALGQDQGVMGDTQAQLTTTQTELADSQTALSGQLSSAQDVDAAATATKLSQVQTQLQASYQLIAGMSDLSLVKFL